MFIHMHVVGQHAHITQYADKYYFCMFPINAKVSTDYDIVSKQGESSDGKGNNGETRAINK